MLRNLFFYLLFLPATLVFSTLAVLSPTGRMARALGRTWGRLVLAFAGARLATDLSGLDPDAAYIFMANHQSNLDIPTLYAVLGRRPFGFVAKESLFRIPLFGKAMLRAGHVPIDRDNPRKAMKAIEYAAEQTAKGFSVVVFPEGTRGTDLSALQEFKIGGMIMALKTGAPVVPLLITGTGAMLPKHALRLRPVREVRVRALPPIVTQGSYTVKDRERFKDDLYALMNGEYLKIREEARG
ncbi:MAG: lysophospholipid acyltransferase family protein [Thermodesulfobacteriota bacterium]